MKNNDLHQPDDSRLKQMAGSGPEFRVPDHYFDRLPSDISERMARPVAGNSFFSLPRLVTVMSVVLVVALAAGYYQYRLQQSDKTVQYFTYDEIINSVYVGEFDDQMLYLEIANDPSFDQTDIDYNNYLIENNVDLSLIMSEL